MTNTLEDNKPESIGTPVERSMTKFEFYFENLLDVLDVAKIKITYGIMKNRSLREIMLHMSDLTEQDKKELFESAIDLFEAQTVMKALASLDAGYISKFSVSDVQSNFQAFRDMVSQLFSEASELKDYKINFKAIRDLRASLKVIKGSKDK